METKDEKTPPSKNLLTNFLNFLNSFSGTPEEKLSSLSSYQVGNKVLSIKFKKFSIIGGHDLFVLNYDQINSPGWHDHVRVCRSLILGLTENNFYPVARSFDRFPDFYENKVESERQLSLLPNKKTTKFHQVVEKKDGSILMLFYHPPTKTWLKSSRTVLGGGKVKKLNTTLGELFDKLLGSSVESFNFDPVYTYIFEVYHPQGNHIITRYQKPFICLLGARKISGEYAPPSYLDQLKLERPIIYLTNATLDDIDKVIEEEKSKNPLFEGVVAIYDSTERVMFKIKNPWYYKFHNNMLHERGPNLTIPDVTIRLHISNYLEKEMKEQNVSKEEETKITKIISIYDTLWREVEKLCKIAEEVTDQKKLADLIKTKPFNRLIFEARKNKNKKILDSVKEMWIQRIDSVISVINDEIQT